MEGPRRIRAEVMTLVPGHLCSPADMLATELELSAQWWPDLRRSLETLSAVQTSRECVDADRIRRFGVEPDLSAVQWETVRGDLHRANLMQPQIRDRWLGMVGTRTSRPERGDPVLLQPPRTCNRAAGLRHIP